MGIFSEAFEERVAELETEAQQLKAELRQYQPSDGMMYKLLGLNEVIREAARLFDKALSDDCSFRLAASSTVLPETWVAIDEWRRHPTVVRAVTSPLAQAKVKP